MELLFVVLIAFGIGVIARYTIPGRDTYGLLLVPSVAAALSAVVWEALTWAGWKFDGGWIWVASLVAGGILAIILAVVVPRTRRRHDTELLSTLSKAKDASPTPSAVRIRRSARARPFVGCAPRSTR
jgi:hypothetical protein